MYDISVIIPMYNVEEYLKPCLNSVVRLVWLVDAEVILVDDGSTDRTAAIALEYVKEYESFSLFQKENGGTSDARNYGAARASGRYLLFVDADDVIVPEVYAEMLQMADRDQSDLTICRHLRLRNGAGQVSSMCLKAFYDLEESVSDIRSHLRFVYAISAWDKLIRRSFYEKNGISFPKGRWYEDYPTTLRMFLLAESVSVCWKTGYLWRIRSGSNPSITQMTDDRKVLEDKFAMIWKSMQTAEEFGDETVTAYLRRKLFIDCLNTALFLPRNLPREEVGFFIDKTVEYMDRIGNEDLLKDLPAIYDQFWHAFHAGDPDTLYRLADLYTQNYGCIPYLYGPDGVSLQLPDPVTAPKTYDAALEDREAPPKIQVRELRQEGTVLHFYGHIFRSRIQASSEYPQEYQALLPAGRGGQRIELPSEAWQTPDLTERYGSAVCMADGTPCHYDYDLSGFHFTLDLKQIAADGSIAGDVPILIRHRSVLEEGSQILAGPMEEVKAWLDRPLHADEDNEISLIIDRSGSFFLRKCPPAEEVQEEFPEEAPGEAEGTL